MINNKKNCEMSNNLKHLKYFSNYIVEQDFGAEAPMDGAAAPAPEPIYSVLFIEKGDEGGDYTYPDGSSSKRYTTYEIKKNELKDWVEATIVIDADGLSKTAAEVKRAALMDYISGVKDGVTPDDKKYVDKFKNAIQTGMKGKKIQDTEVVFSPKEKIPTTNEVDVTFIITKK
jgi:hypothetical protein